MAVCVEAGVGVERAAAVAVGTASMGVGTDAGVGVRTSAEVGVDVGAVAESAVGAAVDAATRRADSAGVGAEVGVDVGTGTEVGVDLRIMTETGVGVTATEGTELAVGVGREVRAGMARPLPQATNASVAATKIATDTVARGVMLILLTATGSSPSGRRYRTLSRLSAWMLPCKRNPKGWPACPVSRLSVCYDFQAKPPDFTGG